MFVAPFGHMSHAGRDAAELAEELVLWTIEHSKGCGVDAGDVASFLALELIGRWRPITARHCRSSWRRSPQPPRPARRWCAKPTGLGSAPRR
jgi:hypothetical protein